MFNPKLSGQSPKISLKSNVFAAWASGELVLLDLVRDKYFGLDEPASRVLAKLISGSNFAHGVADTASENETQSITARLFSLGLIDSVQENESFQLPVVFCAIEPGGLEECTWQPQSSSFVINSCAVPTASMIIKALMRLVNADWVLKLRRLKGIVEYIEAEFSRRNSGLIHQDFSSIALLHNAVQRARRWYPRHVNCVTGSAALALLMLEYGALPKFVVGIQKYPFYAHAWVEYDNLVVNDSQRVRERLAPIISVPLPLSYPCQ